jgi:hypothetical protein
VTSTPTLVDARVHATAVKAALNAVLGPKAEALDYDEVPGMNRNPGPVPNIYVAVSVERRAGAPLRQSATTGRTGWRVGARCVGRTVDECRWALFKVATALNEARLTIGGLDTTPVQFEADQAPEWDDGRYSALALYAYVH